MTKRQVIVLAIVTILFGVANLENGIGQGIFGAVLGFAITYGVIYWINKRRLISPEEKEKVRKEKLKRKQQHKQERAQAKFELQKTKQKEQEIKRQAKIANKKEHEQAMSEKTQALKKAISSSTINTSKSRLRCPHCGSTNVQPLGQHRKGFSVGKAVGGAVLTGGVGALAGFAGKKTKQTDFVCMNCGKQFKK